jgi:ABC-type branched-subunit amino acid transport system substrate-binding protein
MVIVRLIIRRQNEADPASGYRVTLDARDLRQEDLEGTLPPLPPALCQALNDWKQAYSEQEGVRSHYSANVEGDQTSYRIMAGSATQRSVRDTNNLVEALEKGFRDWLLPVDFGWLKIRDSLNRIAGRTTPEPRLIIDLGTANELKRLPWQDWDLLRDNFPQADAALRLFNDDARQRLHEYPYPRSAKVKILVVVGESTGISSSQDLAAITQLQHDDPTRVEVVPLLQPTPATLQAALEDPQGYHIVIYVGHSYSSDDGQAGWLKLNEHDELSIRNFHRALGRAIERGLQLIILNSCDGLGLAQQIARLDAPRCIVMKEPIPDAAAVEFIDRFFRQFVTEGRSLQASVRRARQGLEAFSSRYSEVTWLPTVCIKQNALPLTWQTLLDNLIPDETIPPQPPHLPSTTPPVRPVAGQRWPILAAVAVGAVMVLGGGIWWRQGQQDAPPGSGPGNSPRQISAFISAGDSPNLEGSPTLSGPYADLKQAGMAAFAAEDYATARDQFDAIRTQAEAQRAEFIKNQASPAYNAAVEALLDPTVLIFKNNAEVRRRHYDENQPIYTIAAAVPLTDQASDIGREMLRGIAQAQDKAVNAEALNLSDDQPAVNLEVVIANDRNNPDQARVVAEALTQLDLDENGRKVLAVVGHYLSASTCAALTHAYNSARLVVVSPLSTQTNLRSECDTAGPSLDVFFRTTSSTAVETATLLNHLTTLGLDGPGASVAVFYHEAEAYSADMFKQFEQALTSKDIQITKAFKLGDRNFNAADALRQVPDVDALVVIPDGRNSDATTFERAVEVIKENAGDKVILGSNPLYNQAIIAPAGGLGNLTGKVFIATDWHKKCGQGFNTEVVERYWFGGINRTTALPYESVQALLPFLQGNVASSRLPQALAGLAASSNAPLSQIFDQPTTISFNDNGDRRELTQRILTTFGSNQDDPLEVVGDCPQPASL